jgi:hypothetical protein
VTGDEVRQRFNEQRMTIQRRRTVVAGNARLARGVGKQHIHFIKRFNVIGDE